MVDRRITNVYIITLSYFKTFHSSSPLLSSTANNKGNNNNNIIKWMNGN